MRDPIVRETRKLREEYAAQFIHDVNAVFDDILKRQSLRGRKLVTFSSREPKHRPTFGVKSVIGRAPDSV